MKKTKKFNLRAFILAEAKKLQAESAGLDGIPTPVEKIKPTEYEPGEEADQLESDIDFIKVLKIKEEKLNKVHKNLVKEMRKVQLTKRKLKKRILKKI
jgi:hypothetical protein